MVAGFRDEAPLSIAAVAGGIAWVRYDDEDPQPLRAGDVAIMRGPDHYTGADSPETPPQVIIGPGQAALDGVTVAESMSQGVQSAATDSAGTATTTVITQRCVLRANMRVRGSFALLIRLMLILSQTFVVHPQG